MQNVEMLRAMKQKAQEGAGMIVGVDLGLTGALALYDQRLTKIVTISDMPTREDMRGRRKLDTTEVYYILAQFVRMGAVGVIIEDVHVMHQNGVMAAFSMGHAKGTLEGLCAALSLPCYKIAPQRWKKHYGLLGKEKGDSMILAKEVMPGLEKWVWLKKHHNRAEAALLASLPAGVYAG